MRHDSANSDACDRGTDNPQVGRPRSANTVQRHVLKASGKRGLDQPVTAEMLQERRETSRCDLPPDRPDSARESGHPLELPTA